MYDYDHGKRRFLMLKPAGESAPSATTSRAFVVENWSEELKRLVPRR